MQSVAVSVLIDRPVTEVWNFFSDLRNSPRWTRSGSELRQTSSGAMGVGSTVESRGQFGPFAITSQRLQVTEYEPNRKVWFVGKVPLIGRLVGGFLFEETAQGTRLTRTTQAELGGLLRLLGSRFVRAVGSSQQIELNTLKRLIEERASTR